MNLEQLTNVSEQLYILKRLFPSYKLLIEETEREFQEDLKPIAQKYQLLVNCYYALIHGKENQLND